MSLTVPFSRRALALVASLALVLTVLPWRASPAEAFPVADNAAAYAACGRVFPDPQAYWPSSQQAEGQSPWAKGNFDCRATDFLGWAETLSGLEFLASDEMFADFVEVYDSSEAEGRFADALDLDGGEGMTAGLPAPGGTRDKSPMMFVRVTDEEDTTIPIGDREHFVYTLSIHGIERAGIEGGIRAIEDLATWASCEKHGDDGTAANCAQEDAGPDNPHPILETLPDESVSAGEALKRSSVWFVLSNPDGWRRGDKQDGGFFYQRYNGNGMDLNRDWPTHGWTFRPYTPWSEPETRTAGKVLKDIKDDWTGGIDLHGQGIADAFSYTLIGASERPFGKDRRVLQFTKGAWQDAEQKLSWSSLIKPNDESADDPRLYGVQWGTIWDTIDYTVSGALGDWMDSEMGLNADAIDNEMTLSHIYTCGTGNCFIQENEQLHVDGNKSLIYAMIHYSLTPEDQTFAYDGRAAYLYNPRVISDPGHEATDASEFDLPAQEGEATGPQVHPSADESNSYYPFTVKGVDDGVYNGGLYAEFTFSNVQGVAGSAFNEVAIDRKLEEGEEADPQRGTVEDGWQTMNSYFNQSELYAQAGARVDVNSPPPGEYRLRVTGDVPADWNATIAFTEGATWPDPGQVPFEATNMGFFEMLQDFVPDAENRLVKVSVDDVLSGAIDLAEFDTVIAADDAFVPGYEEPEVFADIPQETITGTAVLQAPGAGERNEATSGYFPFPVEAGQASLTIDVTNSAQGDVDLYLQRQLEDGTWSGDLASGTSGRLDGETMTYNRPDEGQYRVEVHNWAGPPQTVDVEVTFSVDPSGGDEPLNETTIPVDRYPDDNVDTRVTRYTRADVDAMAAKARAFAEQGGNLVLTDSSLRALEWMGLVPDGSVGQSSVYAGHVQFEYESKGDDPGTVVTYDDPLAANVDQPGAAEGPNHRHQVTEPVPLGYAIEDLTGADYPTLPQWTVTRAGWDESGGSIVGTLGAGDVTLGEIPVGDGVVRVLGTLLPFPSDDWDHPFGVADYALTYTGYELAMNLFSWTNPNGTAPPSQVGSEQQEQPAAPLPATGGGSGGAALAVLAVLMGVAAATRLGRHVHAMIARSATRPATT